MPYLEEMVSQTKMRELSVWSLPMSVVCVCVYIAREIEETGNSLTVKVIPSLVLRRSNSYITRGITQKAVKEVISFVILSDATCNNFIGPSKRQ